MTDDLDDRPRTPALSIVEVGRAVPLRLTVVGNHSGNTGEWVESSQQSSSASMLRHGPTRVWQWTVADQAQALVRSTTRRPAFAHCHWSRTPRPAKMPA